MPVARVVTRRVPARVSLTGRCSWFIGHPAALCRDLAAFVIAGQVLREGRDNATSCGGPHPEWPGFMPGLLLRACSARQRYPVAAIKLAARMLAANLLSGGN